MRFASQTPFKNQATIPSQAGTSCTAGASTARSRDGQPSPKQHPQAQGGSRRPGGVNVGRPDGPGTQAAHFLQAPESTPNIQGVGPHDIGPKKAATPGRSRSLRESRVGPSHT